VNRVTQTSTEFWNFGSKIKNNKAARCLCGCFVAKA
jgi:hypothetical protein